MGHDVENRKQFSSAEAVTILENNDMFNEDHRFSSSFSSVETNVCMCSDSNNEISSYSSGNTTKFGQNMTHQRKYTYKGLKEGGDENVLIYQTVR